MAATTWKSTNAKPENTYTSPARKSGAQSKSYMMDVVAPSDWTIDKVHNTILVYLAGIKWMKMSSGIQWLHADYQPQLHDSTQEDFILYLDDFLDSITPQF